jgi:predicted amidohydrolase
MAALFIFLLSAAAVHADLHVAGVQWEMKPEYVADQELFWQDVERTLLSEGLAPLTSQEQLIVFPEYTSVFLTLTEFVPYLFDSPDMQTAWLKVSRDYGYTSIAELFTEETLDTYSYLDNWKKIAVAYNSYLIPGTFFIYDPRQDQVVNRMVIISPEGEVVYYQDKVFMTPFERQLVGLEGSRQYWAEPLEIGGVDVAVTICRDTFFDSWEDEFGDVDLWIDIKANGQQFTQDTKQLFTEAVPERIEDIDGAVGMTVCLTGEFLDLFWEGVSTVVDQDGAILVSAADEKSPDILKFTIRAE